MKSQRFVLTFWATVGLTRAAIDWIADAQMAWGADVIGFVVNAVLAITAPFVILGFWLLFVRDGWPEVGL